MSCAGHVKHRVVCNVNSRQVLEDTELNSVRVIYMGCCGWITFVFRIYVYCSAVRCKALYKQVHII